VQVFIPERADIPPEKDCPRKSLRGFKVEIIEYTIKDMG